MGRVTSPMGGRRRQKLSDRERARLRQEELARQRKHEATGRAEAEKTKRMGVRAGVAAEAAKRGGKPKEAIAIISGRPSPAAERAPRQTTRQRYLQKTYGPEGVAKAKRVRAMHAGLRETDLRMARTRTRTDVEAERRMYAGYKKSPGGDTYFKGEMVMPRRPKLSGIRGMQYLAKPSPEQQTRADQAAAGLAGGKPGMTPQDFVERGYAPRPGETAPQLEGRRQEAWEARFTRQEPEIARASLVQSLDNLNAQLQTATDPAQVAALVQQFDETARQYEATTPMLAGQGPPAQAPAPPSGRMQIPGYAPGEVPPIGYRPPAAVSGDFRMMGPTLGDLEAAPLTAAPPGAEELRLRALAAPPRPVAAPAAAAPAVGAFGGPTPGEMLPTSQAALNLAQAKYYGRMTEDLPAPGAPGSAQRAGMLEDFKSTYDPVVAAFKGDPGTYVSEADAADMQRVYGLVESHLASGKYPQEAARYLQRAPDFMQKVEEAVTHAGWLDKAQQVAPPIVGGLVSRAQQQWHPWMQPFRDRAEWATKLRDLINRTAGTAAQGAAATEPLPSGRTMPGPRGG